MATAPPGRDPKLEQTMLRLAREEFNRWENDPDDSTHNFDVQLRREFPDTEVVITFDHTARPGCRFGYTWPLYGDAWDEMETPETQLTILWANLTEVLCSEWYGLPDNCRPGEVVWLGRLRVVLEIELAFDHVLAGYAGQFDGNERRLRGDLMEALGQIAEKYLLDKREVGGVIHAARQRVLLREYAEGESD